MVPSHRGRAHGWRGEYPVRSRNVVSGRLAMGCAAVTVCGLALGPLTAAAQAAAPATATWQLPVEQTHPPQTKAQDDYGMQHGRPLPPREVLQPALDPGLRNFEPRHGADFSGTLRLMGSDVLPGLVRAWVRGFTHRYPRVRVIFGPPFEGSDAAQALVAGDIDIASVSRELKPTDVASFQTKYAYAPTSVPVSGGSWRQYGFLDAVAFIVNPANPVQQLSLEQLDAVFSSSHLRGDQPAVTWGQLGATGEWESRPVHVYAIKPWNGFEEFVRQRVLSADGRRGEWRTGIHMDPTVFPLARRVAADPDAIGYTGLAFVDAPVRVLAVGQGANAIPPSYTEVALAQYPLSRLVYANVNLRLGKALPPAVQEFLRFILSRQGQEAVRKEGIFLPLRESQVIDAENIGGLADRGGR